MIYRDCLLGFSDLFRKSSGKNNAPPGRNPRCGIPSLSLRSDFFYTGLARYALLDLIEIFNIRGQDNVLVPAYICRDSLIPLKERDISYKFYKIKDDFSCDAESLAEAKDENTKALVYVDYFGLSGNFSFYEDFCRKYGLYLVEDNAHAFVVDYSNLRGDAAIFSLRKFLPSPNGALGVVKKRFGFKQERLAQGQDVVFSLADGRFLAGQALRKFYSLSSGFSFSRRLLRRKKIQQHSANANKSDVSDRGLRQMTKLSSSIIKRMDHKRIFVQRRENYNLLLSQIKDSDCGKMKILFSRLQDGIAPLAFPVLVGSSRQQFLDHLFLSGFIAYPWPDLPSEVDSDFYPIEFSLARQVVLLPIHQGLKVSEIKKMAGVIRDWLK